MPGCRALIPSRTNNELWPCSAGNGLQNANGYHLPAVRSTSRGENSSTATDGVALNRSKGPPSVAIFNTLILVPQQPFDRGMQAPPPGSEYCDGFRRRTPTRGLLCLDYHRNTSILCRQGPLQTTKIPFVFEPPPSVLVTRTSGSIEILCTPFNGRYSVTATSSWDGRHSSCVTNVGARHSYLSHHNRRNLRPRPFGHAL